MYELLLSCFSQILLGTYSAGLLRPYNTIHSILDLAGGSDPEYYHVVLFVRSYFGRMSIQLDTCDRCLNNLLLPPSYSVTLSAERCV